MIDELVEHLKKEEGWVPHAYRDHLGYLTIGYGFLIDEEKGGELPKCIGEQWLMYAASRMWWEMCRQHKWLLDQPEEVQVAVGSMVYQMGVHGVSRFRRMLEALAAGDRERAADLALESKWARQAPARAKRVTDLIRG